MKKLHPTQQKLLQLLRENHDDPLTVRELQEELEVSSSSVVQHHITQLEKKGYLRRNPNNPKDYQILSDSPEKKITYLNLYGQAQCGKNGSVLDGDPIDRIPISTKILGFPSDEAFLVKAKGDSMTPRIKENDLVIVRKSQTPKNGDVVVCVNDGEVLIKKVNWDDKQVILTSLNKEYPPFIASSESFNVEGVVKGVVSYL